jgi:hypothetical protein
MYIKSPSKIIFVLFCLLPVFFCKCQSIIPKATIIDGIIHIDLSKINLENNVSIIGLDTALVAFEVIPLETTKDVLIDSNDRLFDVSENYIVFGSTRGDIFIFYRNGKIKSHFNRQGRGPEEYSFRYIVIIDEKNEEILVFDGWFGPILVYSLFGQYKRTLRYSTELQITEAFNFDDETMLVYDRKGVNSNDNYSKRPYMFMSKQDGSITDTLNIYLPVRYPTNVIYRWTDSSGTNFEQSTSFGIRSNRFFGHNFVISDISSDTIYLLKRNRELTPLIVRTPSVHTTTPNLVVLHEFSTDKFICLTVSYLDYDSLLDLTPIPLRTLMIDLETLEISNVSLITYNISLPNTKAVWVFPDQLKSLYERFKNNPDRPLRIPEVVLNMAPLLGEEDNPVVYLTRFK